MSDPQPEQKPSNVIDIRERLSVSSPLDFEWINLMIYAESGVGKTHFCGTAMDHPDTSPVLMIDIEEGTSTLRRWPGIDIRRARNTKDLETIHNELFMYNQGWYKTVCIDSVTDLQDLDMRIIMREAKATAKNPENVDIDVPSPREWGKNRSHMRGILRSYRDLPMNTIITAMLYEKEEEGKPTRFIPDLPGKQLAELPGFMDIVGLYQKDITDPRKRILQITGTRRVKAKTRFAELGELIENPTIPMIWERIKAANGTIAT